MKLIIGEIALNNFYALLKILKVLTNIISYQCLMHIFLKAKTTKL
jgi:hypothetical protein